MSDVVSETGQVFLTKQELAVRWRCKTRTIELWVREKRIPAPFKPNYKTALWSLGDIIDHEEKVKAKCAKQNKKR